MSGQNLADHKLEHRLFVRNQLSHSLVAAMLAHITRIKPGLGHRHIGLSTEPLLVGESPLRGLLTGLNRAKRKNYLANANGVIAHEPANNRNMPGTECGTAGCDSGGYTGKM